MKVYKQNDGDSVKVIVGGHVVKKLHVTHEQQCSELNWRGRG